MEEVVKTVVQRIPMEWTQFIIFFLGVFGLWLWNRAESRSDARHFDNKLAASRAETNALIEAIRQDVKEFHQEMRDFHIQMAKQDTEFKAHLIYEHGQNRTQQ